MAKKPNQCIIDKINEGMSESDATSVCSPKKVNQTPPPPSGKRRSDHRRTRTKRARRGRDFWQY